MKDAKVTWNEYLNNPNVRPKCFNVTFERNDDGTFRIIGNSAIMLEAVNQHQAKVVKVDARNLASTLNKSRITAL
jgi:hypothetical protein